MRSRRRLRDPRRQSLLATAALLVCALLAGFSAWMREVDGVLHRPGLSYLLYTFALLAAAGAAATKARAAEILVVFRPRRTRVVAVLSLVAGLLTMLLSCVLASTSGVGSNEGSIRAIAEAGIVGGVGFGLAGFLTLFWTAGLDYLGDRIDQMSEEEW